MNGSILLPLHAAAGARLTADGRAVLTYGDVPAEYQAGRAGAVLFDATDRESVRVTGAEAGTFLHRLLANDARALEVGASQRGLLLSAKGKVRFDFDLARDADGYVVSLPAEGARAFLTALDTYLFAEKVRLSDATALHAPLDVAGPRAADVVRAATGLDAPATPRRVTNGTFAGAPLAVTSLTVAGSRGWRLDAGPAQAPALWRALVDAGARPAGWIARDCLRVEAGAAQPLVDVDETVYPQEARLEEAFALDKGCYIGQEVVAKIDTYGGLNKRLVALKVSHDDPLAHGTRLFRLDDGEWRDLGVVTSWAYSFVLDTGLVLAYVKRRHQAVGTTFRVGDGPATAEIVSLPVRPDAVPPTGEFE